ncbi:hypothetical protein D3C85_1428430 [compost metagenome]
MPLMAFSRRVLSSTGSTYAALIRSMTSANVRSSSSGRGALAAAASVVVAGRAGSAAQARGAPMTTASARAREVRREEYSMTNELLILFCALRGIGAAIGDSSHAGKYWSRPILGSGTIARGRSGGPADESRNTTPACPAHHCCPRSRWPHPP